MIDDPVIISAIFAGIVSVLGLTFKHIKTSHCWSNEDCCDCSTKEAIGIATVILSYKRQRT